jgi:hypothetical protein
LLSNFRAAAANSALCPIRDNSRTQRVITDATQSAAKVSTAAQELPDEAMSFYSLNAHNAAHGSVLPPIVSLS